MLGLAATLKCIAAALALAMLALGVVRGGASLLVLAIISPMEAMTWEAKWPLQHQEDTQYATVRIYAQGSRVMFGIGPSCESLFDRATCTALGPYALLLSEAISTRAPGRALIVGGAGNALALELESRGWSVTVCEIDERIAQLSDKYFGAMKGRWAIGDGRAVLRSCGRSEFDYVVLDAFAGPGIIPDHLSSQEFLGEVSRVLKPDGLCAMNTICVVGGSESELFVSYAATMRSVFPFVTYAPVTDVSNRSRSYQNVLLFGRSDQGELSVRARVVGQVGGTVLTDDCSNASELAARLQAIHWSGYPIGRHAASAHGM